MKITRWSPDTCDCIIDNEWDDSLPVDQIVVTPISVFRKCNAHTSLPDDQTVMSVVNEENPRKNTTHKGILDNGPSSLYDIVDGSRQLKSGVSFTWSWSGTAPNRILTVRIVGATLTTQQRNTAQTWLNNKFSVGKVVLG